MLQASTTWNRQHTISLLFIPTRKLVNLARSVIATILEPRLTPGGTRIKVLVRGEEKVCATLCSVLGKWQVWRHHNSLSNFFTSQETLRKLPMMYFCQFSCLSVIMSSRMRWRCYDSSCSSLDWFLMVIIRLISAAVLSSALFLLQLPWLLYTSSFMELKRTSINHERLNYD